MPRLARRRSLTCAVTVGMLLGATLTAAAQAQDDPYATVEEQAETSQLDTDLTPVAKETPHWDLLHGAEYPEAQVVENSVTRFDTELFSVSFRNTQLGLAGGSACATEPVQQQGEDNGEFGARVAECKGTDDSQVSRVPALYRFSASADQDDTWERLELPNAPNLEHPGPGYIGAVDWATPETALIVGGTGTYPRREQPADPLPATDPEKPDPAGKARAWLYHRTSGEVEELDLSALTPDDTASSPPRAGMRGMSAAGCYEDPTPGQRWVQQGISNTLVSDPNPDIELCFAGALGQIWEWRDGEFTGERVDAQSPASKLSGAAIFRYRVRDIDFRFNTTNKEEPPQAVTVTAGCCAESELDNVGTVLRYDATWSAQTLFGKEIPDSFYSVMAPPSGTTTISLIATPGGPETPGERPSVIATQHTSTQAFNVLRTPLSTVRLHSGDGDSRVSDPNRLSSLSTHASFFANRQPDWVVGELRSTQRTGLGAQGLVVATALPPTAADSVNPAPSTPEEITSGWEPIDQEKLDAHVRSRHYLLPSYSANAVEILGAGDDGWAVGDHGAILRLDTGELQQTTAAAEPKPPKLGAARQASLSDRSAYAEQQLPEVAGAVPALGELGTTELDEPEMVASGVPGGQVEEVIMSRDASEGWAIGNDAGGATFAHFDGIRWTRCDPVGIPGKVAPDPACAAMAPLRGYRDAAGALRNVRIDLATRVPLENDPYPTNDDELEIFAIGSAYTGPETGGKTFPYTSLRYSDGRWRFEDLEAAKSLDAAANGLTFEHMAAISSDEMWAIADEGHGGAGEVNTRLLLYDGMAWIACHEVPGRCGSAARLPPNPDTIAGLTAAGRRLYLYGRRHDIGGSACTGTTCVAREAPLIIYRDPGGEWTDGSEDGGDDGGLDPGFADSATQEEGHVDSLSVVPVPGGGFEGWAVGEFGGLKSPTNSSLHIAEPTTALMRLHPGEAGWRAFTTPDVFYRPSPVNLGRSVVSERRLQVTYPSAVAPDGAFIGQQRDLATVTSDRIIGFDSARGRFGDVDSGRPQGNPIIQAGGRPSPQGTPRAMAPDGAGGFWAAITDSAIGNTLFRYTDTPPKPIFTEVANPLGPRGVKLRDLAAGPDGSVWAASDSERLFRYSRGLGWEEVRIPGWDPGRVVTRASAVNAIALGPGGEGLAVGEQGRIAELSPAGVKLDPAAGTSCALKAGAPCGTSRNLTAVDVAPDGAAFAAGEALSILWRPPGGEFRSLETKPKAAASTQIAAVSYPSSTRAYLATATGRIYRGDSSGAGDWSWTLENATADGDYVSVGANGAPTPIRDIAVDAQGHGYAVGDGGMIVERTEGGGWKRLPAHHPYDLTSVALPETGGEGGLVGGEGGAILTVHGDEVETARHPNYRADNNILLGEVVGFAYLPGSSEGSVDAWAGVGGATQGGGADGPHLLRYRSDPGDPLLDSDDGASALADAPAKTEGELSLAAFGKSDCAEPEAELCPEMSATTTTNELINQRIVKELKERRQEGALDAAILSGDATDSAGLPGSAVGDYDRNLATPTAPLGPTQVAGQLKHRRYDEYVVDRLEDEGISLFAALGGQDLSETFACSTDGCQTAKRFASAGESYAWREAFAGQAEPWGDGSDTVEAESQSEISFESAPGSEDNSLRIEGQSADADGEGIAPEAKAEIGGANTHYAVEAVNNGEAIARIVFVDTSLRSLQASDLLQQPHELAGGQQRFLERMICKEGSSSTFGDRCTRGNDQRAIVVSNTPTYSYGPGALTHTALDGTTFEATMLRYDVDLVISGALGYNGLYYTLAPGVHEPCPAGGYPEAPPSGNAPDCLAGPTGPADEAQKRLGESPAAEHLPGDPASLISEQGLSGAYPTLIASGAGGKLGPDGKEPPDGPAGQWHGYSVARLLANGDLVVEQRPILDWIGLDAPDHAIAPRARLKLNGFGRSPVSTTVESATSLAHHYEISNPAITHRYDLLLADPEKPWLPCSEDDINCQELHANLEGEGGSEATAEESSTGEQNPCSPYLCLPSRIGVVDDQSGQVRAGDGKYPETFALAMLSVDEEVATYPLVFKRSPAFVTSPSIRTGALPKLSGARPGAPPPPPPPPGLPQIPQVDVPQIPPPPGIPQLTAATPPELQPPAPPAPPPPSQQPAPLDLSVAPPGVSISTPTALIQPPTPPVNPAPPGGARREARQRQAAAQKGGADSGDEGAGGADGQASDLADSPPSAHGTSNMTRIEAIAGSRRKPEPSFTMLSRERAGSGGQAALYGGGITLAALVLALGYGTLRPTPRRRLPEVPAPATARNRGRRN